MQKNQTSQGDGIIGLVREAIEGLGDLVSQHLHLARLELVSDLRKVGHRARRTAIFGGLGLVGYTLGLAGLAVFLGGHRPVGFWLLLFGGVHLLAAGVGLLLGRNQGAGTQMMDSNREQVGESLAVLQRAVAPQASPTAALAAPAAALTAPAAHSNSRIPAARR